MFANRRPFWVLPVVLTFGRGERHGVIKFARICSDRAQFAAKGRGKTAPSVGLQGRRKSQDGLELGPETQDAAALTCCGVWPCVVHRTSIPDRISLKEHCVSRGLPAQGLHMILFSNRGLPFQFQFFGGVCGVCCGRCCRCIRSSWRGLATIFCYRGCTPIHPFVNPPAGGGIRRIGEPIEH